jgi:cobalt/nickel transport protein
VKLLTSALAAAALSAAVLVRPAQAHFQLIYTPEANLEKAGNIPLLLVFWHPFSNGHAMDMGRPEQFFVVHKGEKTDLSGKLRSVTFKGAENTATAYEATVPVRRLGDYVFVVMPAPYLEKAEDKYIQQITKSYVNLGGSPTGWDKPVGLATEIVPLNKPTAIMTGSTFTGQLLSEGKPVAGAEIEVEYMAAEPDIAAHKAGNPTVSPPPGGALVVMTDDNGMFTFGIPRPGFWGFAALGSGPAKQHDGKELSQDAVLWVRANDLK